MSRRRSVSLGALGALLIASAVVFAYTRVRQQPPAPAPNAPQAEAAIAPFNQDAPAAPAAPEAVAPALAQAEPAAPRVSAPTRAAAPAAAAEPREEGARPALSETGEVASSSTEAAPAAEAAPVAEAATDASAAPAAEAAAEVAEAQVSYEIKRDTRQRRTVTIARNGEPRAVSFKDGPLPFDKPREAMQWYVQKRLAAGMTELPVERYFAAAEKIKQLPQYSTALQRIEPSEAEQVKRGLAAPQGAGGNTQGVLGAWSSLGPGNVGGRTRALLIDPVTPNVMYMAGVVGGIWKSTNAGASWTPLNDFMPNIGVTCMAFKPGDPNTIYAGTGEGFFNIDAVRGAGIFRSTDAGATWFRLPATANNANFNFVNDLVVSNVDPRRIYAATGTGVWRSLDGGATWAMILNVPTVAPSATGVRGAMDLVMRTDQATDYLFVAAGSAFSSGEPQSRIYRSTDAASAAVVPTGNTPAAGSFTEIFTDANMARTSLAIAPSNQNVIYALAASKEGGNYSLGMLGVFRSTSSGDPGSWTTQTGPANRAADKQSSLILSNTINALLVECGFGASNQFLNQGWYDNVIAVDPTDENKVWAGGIDVFRSDNGGVNWGVASYWWFQSNGTPPANGDPQLVHADNHLIAFHPNYNGTDNQTMIVTNDGGIYKTDNAKTGNVGYATGTTPAPGVVTPASPVCGALTPTMPSPVTWSPLNNGYAVTQFYHGLPYPNGTTYFGGTQDNGTNRGTDAGGPNAWSRILGGDGGYVAVDPSNTNVLYAENTQNTFQKSTNGGASFAAARTGISGDTFPFISVFRMDPNTPARLWYAGRFMWRTDNSAGNWTRTSDAQQTGGAITAMAIAPGDSNKVINGAASGQIRRTTAGTTATSTSVLNSVWIQSFTPRGNGFGGISWLEYDPSNTNIVWATVSAFNTSTSGNGFGHVFKSTDGGATWALADGNQTANNLNAIPDIPAHSVAVDPTNGQRVYVGTDLGVFVTLDGGANWYKEVTGFANTPVETLALNTTGGQTSLFAFTHGRGAYRVTVSSSCATVAPNTAQNFPAEGGTGTFVVTATAGCGWTASNFAGFLAINTGETGSGPGTVTYTVAPNASTSTRAGTINVAGTTINITQDAAPDNSIVGQITLNATDQGSVGTTVNLSGSSAASTVTNAAGGYIFSGLTPGGSYTVTPSGGVGVTYSPASRTIASLSGIGVANFVGASSAVSVPAAQGTLIISEFRLRGAGGANDEFVEVYNTSNSPVTVTTNDNSEGWAIVTGDGVPRFIIPNLVTIPARGHYLAANTTDPDGAGPLTAYSLSAYGGTGAAAPDGTYSADTPDGLGLSLFSTAKPENFTEAYRLDAVGFAGESNVLAREGAALASTGTTDGQYSFARKLTSGVPQDTGDNAADFYLVSTNAGLINGVQSVLGAPGPENLASPVTRNASIKASLIDPLQSAGAAPNSERKFCATPGVEECDPNRSQFGTFSIRRRFTNTTGADVTRLRFRITYMTTGPTPPAGTADLRAITSGAVTGVVITGGGTVTIEGTTLETPPAQTVGGGINSTLSVGTITTATPLAPGASLNLQFLLGVQQPGGYAFFVNVEASPQPPGPPFEPAVKATRQTQKATPKER